MFTGLVFKDSDKMSEFGKINIMDPRMKKPLLHTSHDNSFSLVSQSVSEVKFDNGNKLEFFTPNNIGIQRNIQSILRKI